MENPTHHPIDFESLYSSK